MTHERTIYSLPAAQPFESPSSWLTRAALAQGISLREMLKALGLEGCRDPDQELVDEVSFARVSSICGLDAAAFFVARRIVRRLKSVGEARHRLLLSGPNGRPRYRICPVCMRKDRTPHAYIHWRFSCWRYCPEHDCLMVEQCWVCNSPIELPATMFWPDQRGRTYLSQCLACGKPHGRGPVRHLGAELQEVGLVHQMLLRNGRAVLAALYAGYVQVADAKVAPLSRISKLERMGVLGTGRMGFSGEPRVPMNSELHPLSEVTK